MSSVGEQMPKEIDRVRKLQDEFKALRNTPGVIVEPQIMMMEAAIQRGIRALASDDVVEVLRSYEELKSYEG